MTNIVQLLDDNGWRNKELLHQKYVVERRSLTEHTVEFSVAQQTIPRQIRWLGIQNGVPGTAQNGKRGLAYGKKV